MSARKYQEARRRRAARGRENQVPSPASAQDRPESTDRPGRLDDPDYLTTVGVTTVVTGDPILGVLAGELFR